jgi:N-methylhydantoinase A
MPNASPPWRVGVDTGGTFTDLVLVDGDGVIRATHKRLSTPDDPGRAVLEGIAKLLDAGSTANTTPDTPPAVVHGSTVATNALLEGKGADAALVTTAGFEDVLTIARQNRPDLYATVPRRPPPPIRRAMTLGADERTAFDGSVITPLDPHTLDALTQQLARLNPESVAVCLLHSYANPEHEQQIAQAIRDKLPGVHLTLSHELLPELREYERAATCAANAVVGPAMSRYLTRLDRELGGHRLRIMGSGGGTLPVGFVCDRPIETVTSGPAGGAIGAWAMARAVGIDRVIGFDMGGTSTDVTLIDGGPTRTTHTTIAGLPIRLPMIDIHTVGAGGGSIAHIDLGGAMRVGPESAGAVPGPACYGRQRPDRPLATVTDAHAVLGHLTDGRQLGDSLAINRDAAVHAVRDLAQHTSLSVEETALGVLRIADAAMARAVQQISVQRGYDLRRFTLLAFGGAGGLHACRLAEVLGMTRVLIPRHGGLLSAVGMLATPPRYSFSHAAIATLTADASGRYPDPLGLPAVQHAAATLRRLGRDALERDGVHDTEQHLGLFLDMRYSGQSHELSIPLGTGDTAEHFQKEHERLYGYAPVGRDIETVTARIEATGPAPEVRAAAAGQPDKAPRFDQHDVPVTDRDGVANWPCVQREALVPGQRHTGPMLIEEYAATTVIPRGWNLEVLADGQLSVTR